METYQLRHAQAGDARFIAAAILTATRSHLARGWFDIALNRSEAECLEFLTLLTTATTRSQWHYSGFLVAEETSCPTAALCAVRAADVYPTAPMAILGTLKNMGVTQRERELFWKRGAYLFRCTTRPDDECLTIEVAATLSGHRRRGYTAALLERALQDGRREGFRVAQTTCLVGNDAAQRIYERAGFRVTGELCDAEFEAITGAPGIRSFSIAL